LRSARNRALGAPHGVMRVNRIGTRRAQNLVTDEALPSDRPRGSQDMDMDTDIRDPGGNA